MIEIFCPICKKTHKTLLYKCECGYYEGKIDITNYNDETNQLFSIYKFSKLIFNKKIDWEQSKYDIEEYNNKIAYIEYIYEKKSIAYVDLNIEEKQTKVVAGVLAFNKDVKSLIINANSINHEMLDESNVRMLFLGNKVNHIYAFLNSSLKYIEVSKDNPYFTAQNNVLFDKKMKRLIFYCNLKPDEEYIIPKSVKEVASRAFINSSLYTNLKIIHCSKNVKFEDPACIPSPYDSIKIIYDQD